MNLLVLTGLVIGVLAFIFSMLGLGGAMVYIPAFTWFGFDMKTVAIPTGLLLNGVTALSAATYYLRANMVDIRGSVPLIVTSLIAAPIGAQVTPYVSTDALKVLFAIAMVLSGAKMLLSSGKPEPTALMPFRKRAILTGVAGLGIGFLAGLLGIGGGFLFVPMLIAMGYPTKQAAATSSFVVIFSSFSGFAGHVAQGNYNWWLMGICLVAVIIGSQIGAKVMNEKMKARWIKRLFGVLLIGVAIKFVWPIFSH
ncbi:sulfite exporter TauE/SafE family protein [Thioclava sp.]|uniref:sulfite exporter TauE/SafE family protein n=1 Tax=Thioclava sp. TaxID=1933450 RepID=UPI003AA8A673